MLFLHPFDLEGGCIRTIIFGVLLRNRRFFFNPSRSGFNIPDVIESARFYVDIPFELISSIENRERKSFWEVAHFGISEPPLPVIPDLKKIYLYKSFFTEYDLNWSLHCPMGDLDSAGGVPEANVWGLGVILESFLGGITKSSRIPR